MELSPFIAPHATDTCRLLALYGGAIVCTTGALELAVTYVRKEGCHIPRLVHVEDVDTREQRVFVLDEVTGEYGSHNLRLYPLAPDARTLLPEVHLCLGADLGHLVEAFLADLLPIPRPTHAHTDHLRRQIRWQADGVAWQHYWDNASPGRKRGRTRQNVWVSRKQTTTDVQ